MPKIDYTKKWKILTSLQNLPKNVGDLGKLNVAKGFKKLPKIQKIAKSGHTGAKKHFSTENQYYKTYFALSDGTIAGN